MPLPVPTLVALSLLAPLGLPWSQDERGSLEDFLERARAEQAALHGRLQGQVDGLIKQLEELDRNSRRRKANGLVLRVVELGTNATPLLVPYIDPGVEATDKKSYRAGKVSDALERMNVAPITAQLIRALQTGSEHGRSNAARVLASASDRERVRPEVLAAFRAGEGDLKATCLRTLISLGGPENEVLLSEVLGGSDEALVDLALEALAELRSEEVALQVRAILRDKARAERHAPALVTYYSALPDLVDEEELADFVRIARSNAAVEVRIAVIDALPDFDPSLGDVKKALAPIVSSRDEDLREAGLVCLARLGDRGSKKRLLEPYDAVVERNKAWSEAYDDRARIYFRIEDYDKAIHDYKDALKLGRDDPKPVPERKVMLARCYARKGKLKDAAEHLGSAPISIDERRAYGDDPDFRELRESRWGQKLFDG